MSVRRLGVARALVAGELVEGDVEVEDSRVVAVGLPPASAGGTAVPGLVDLQLNGFGGHDLRTADADGWAAAGRALAAHGAVAVQPTFFSCTLDTYRAALATLADVRAGADRRAPDGCRFLPAHLEGPFLSPTWAAAHRVEHFVAPDAGALRLLLEAGPVGMVTLAPELPGGTDLVAQVARSGAVPSIGHSDATAAQVLAAVDAGARHLTHCWNAHRRFAPRDPGPAGVALVDDRLTVGLIADLVHTAPETVQLTAAAVAGRLAATTDAVPPAGTTARRWVEDGREVIVADGAARLGDGTLAGSVATPDALLRHLVGVGLPLPAAVDACGGAQRRLLGLPTVDLRPGDPADLVVLDDRLQPLRTLVDGVEVWCGPGGPEQVADAAGAATA